MLRIRPEQLEKLSLAPFQLILDRWARELRLEYPDATADCPEAELRTLLADRADDAAGYGLEELIHIREFLELSLRFGAPTAGPLQEDWILEVLQDTSLNELEKMDRIAEKLLEIDGDSEFEPLDTPTDDEPGADDDDEDEDNGAAVVVDPRFEVPDDPEELELSGGIEGAIRW